MSEEPGSWQRRYEDAAERLRSLGPDTFGERIKRLREDIDCFRRDLKYLDGGGIFVLAPDTSEIVSYINPYFAIGSYCFPIEDRATFDRSFAKRQQRETDFDKAVETRKIGRRVLRARAHLFNPPQYNILLPPYLSELDFVLSVILAARGPNDLDAVFRMIEDNTDRLERENTGLVAELSRFETLTESRQDELLESIFEKVVSDPTVFSDDMVVNNRARRISQIARARDFLNKTESYGVSDYSWSAVSGVDDPDLIARLRAVTPDETLVQYMENLLNMLPRSVRTSFGVYNDAQALAYLAAINEQLQEYRRERVRVQLVTWALAPVTVSRAFWPEESGSAGMGPLVQVRHPKLLAAAIDFLNSGERRGQVESDLDRFSEALSLFQAGGQDEDQEKRDEKLTNVRSAWQKLDNTLLAGSSPIGEGSEAPAAESATSLEAIRGIVVNNRAAFAKFLTKKIDNVSKELSDSHWRVVQPANVESIGADCLLHEPGRRIVLRSHEDHARFAIALYSPVIVEHIYEPLNRGMSFGSTLLELTRKYSVETAGRDSDLGIRAETQLLKAFLFAMLRDNVLAARYAGLARAELGQSASGDHNLIRAEVFYLAHYAHRSLGIERSSGEEFRVCLKSLENSRAEWKPGTGEQSRQLLPRYLVSWVTTCREIAASEVADFRWEDAWKELAENAYQGCLGLLERGVLRPGHPEAKLENYHIGRATQNVMLVFAFDRLGVGTWRRSFADVIRPTEQHARRAWDVMKELREHGDRRFLEHMTRNELAFQIGSSWFSESPAERTAAARAVSAMRAAFEGDPTIQRVVRDFIRESNI